MVRHVRRDRRLTCRPGHLRATGRASAPSRTTPGNCSRRVRYLLCDLLALLVLTAVGLCLAGDFGSGRRRVREGGRPCRRPPPAAPCRPPQCRPSSAADSFAAGGSCAAPHTTSAGPWCPGRLREPVRPPTAKQSSRGPHRGILSAAPRPLAHLVHDQFRSAGRPPAHPPIRCSRSSIGPVLRQACRR